MKFCVQRAVREVERLNVAPRPAPIFSFRRGILFNYAFGDLAVDGVIDSNERNSEEFERIVSNLRAEVGVAVRVFAARDRCRRLTCCRSEFMLAPFS